MTIYLDADFWVCLRWVEVLFFHFCFLSEFLENACLLSGRTFSLELMVVAT